MPSARLLTENRLPINTRREARREREVSESERDRGEGKREIDR